MATTTEMLSLGTKFVPPRQNLGVSIHTYKRESLAVENDILRNVRSTTTLEKNKKKKKKLEKSIKFNSYCIHKKCGLRVWNNATSSVRWPCSHIYTWSLLKCSFGRVRGKIGTKLTVSSYVHISQSPNSSASGRPSNPSFCHCCRDNSFA